MTRPDARTEAAEARRRRRRILGGTSMTAPGSRGARCFDLYEENPSAARDIYEEFLLIGCSGRNRACVRPPGNVPGVTAAPQRSSAEAPRVDVGVVTWNTRDL